jgi:hypothetical protein
MGRFFLEPVQFRLEPADLLVELGLQGLLLSAGGLGAVLEQLLGVADELLLPGMDQGRRHAVKARQRADGLVALHRRERHLGLERRGRGLPFPRHGYPFLGQPTVAYSTVQFLGSTSLPRVIEVGRADLKNN